MNLQREPLAIVGTIGSLIGAFLVLMQSFGIPVTDAQSQAINNFVVIAAPLIVAMIGRQYVFSPDTARALQIEAWDAGSPPTEALPTLPDPPGGNEPQQETSEEGVQRFTNVRH